MEKQLAKEPRVQKSMEIAQLIKLLDKPKSQIVGPLRELIVRKDESIPLLLDSLKNALEDYKRKCLEQSGFLFALYILSYLRVPLAFPFVIKLALLPADMVKKVLGGHVSAGLTSWLISTYNGDFQVIKRVVENKTASSYCRNAALNSIVGLYAQGMLTRKEIVSYFRELLRSDLIKDYEFATSLASVAIRMHPKELYDDIMFLFKNDYIEIFFVSIEDLKSALVLSQEECIKKYILKYDEYTPVTDVLDRTSWIISNVEERIKKMGRNEPCHCGSGKKYKKCCLI